MILRLAMMELFFGGKLSHASSKKCIKMATKRKSISTLNGKKNTNKVVTEFNSLFNNQKRNWQGDRKHVEI